MVPAVVLTLIPQDVHQSRPPGPLGGRKVDGCSSFGQKNFVEFFICRFDCFGVLWCLRLFTQKIPPEVDLRLLFEGFFAVLSKKDRNVCYIGGNAFVDLVFVVFGKVDG